MITFFCCTEKVKLNYSIGAIDGPTYQTVFEPVINKTDIQADKIYFCPPNCFQNQMKIFGLQCEKANEIFFTIEPDIIYSLKEFPKDVGFSKFDLLEEFKGKAEVKIGIINAMSHAIGDNLVGMQVFDYWRTKIFEFLPNSKVIISFFKINTLKVESITKQFSVDNVYTLPSNLMLLLEQDAYIDLGTFVQEEEFKTLNMFDFFLKALSINPETVRKEDKRIKWDANQPKC